MFVYYIHTLANEDLDGSLFDFRVLLTLTKVTILRNIKEILTALVLTKVEHLT